MSFTFRTFQLMAETVTFQFKCTVAKETNQITNSEKPISFLFACGPNLKVLICSDHVILSTFIKYSRYFSSSFFDDV